MLFFFLDSLLKEKFFLFFFFVWIHKGPKALLCNATPSCRERGQQLRLREEERQQEEKREVKDQRSLVCQAALRFLVSKWDLSLSALLFCHISVGPLPCGKGGDGILLTSNNLSIYTSSLTLSRSISWEWRTKVTYPSATSMPGFCATGREKTKTKKHLDSWGLRHHMVTQSLWLDLQVRPHILRQLSPKITAKDRI